MSKQKDKQPSFKDFFNDLVKKSVTSAKSIESIEERKYFLIVCEGERTEPQYFNYFKTILPKQLLKTIEITGEGDNTINIVKKAITLRKERLENISLPNFDEVWAVYDRDDFPIERYNAAIQLAEDSGINSGHSNQSFELWYVLHFQYLQSDLHRSDYIKILTKNLGFKYEKNDIKVVKYLFEKRDVKQAIQWAKQLELLHIDHNAAQSCPSTQVYKLVEQLMVYCKI